VRQQPSRPQQNIASSLKLINRVLLFRGQGSPVLLLFAHAPATDIAELLLYITTSGTTKIYWSLHRLLLLHLNVSQQEYQEYLQSASLSLLLCVCKCA
jgi:hypothetical protein